MRVVTELDAGPTFAIASAPIPPDATSGDMERTLAHLGPVLLLAVVADLAAGRAVETAQDDARATHAAKITKSEGAIDWTEPAGARRRVRDAARRRSGTGGSAVGARPDADQAQ